MRKILLFITALSVSLFACIKPDASAPSSLLDGKWRMVTVTDNASGTSITKPAGITGNVDISFTTVTATTGNFNGNTPTNDIDLNSFSFGANQSLSIPNMSMTKVGETTWGNEFVNNIRNAQEYNFATDGKLNIKTAAKVLSFIKL